MKALHSEKAPKALGPYSQAICAGGFVFASGQVPIDPATGEFAEGGMHYGRNSNGRQTYWQSLSSGSTSLVEVVPGGVARKSAAGR